MEKSAIGHLSGKSMLEGVFHLRKKIGLVEKLSGLKRGQMVIKFVLRQPRYSAKQTEGNHRTNNGGGLQQMFFLDVQSIYTIRHNILHPTRDTNAVDFQPWSIGSFRSS